MIILYILFLLYLLFPDENLVYTADPVTVLVGMALGTGMAAAGGAFNKPKTPNVPPVPKLDPKPTTVSESFREDQKKKLAKYQGRRSTILTSGLGSLGDLQVQKKTLLGE